MKTSPVQNVRIKLKQVFPVSLAFVLRRNFTYVSVLVIMSLFFLSISVFFGQLDGKIFGDVQQFLMLKKILIVSIVSAVVLVRLTYDALFWMRYDYYIERGRLHIESGVVIRQESSVPLNPLCEFYLEKGWVDLIFGTKDLIMKAAIGERQEVCRIPALKEVDAKALKRFLIEQAEQGSIGGQAPAEVEIPFVLAHGY